MNEEWQSISLKTDNATNMMIVEALVPAKSPWFLGHFPSQPILPGIALISMAFDGIKLYEAEKGNKIKMVGVRKVKFKKPVKPDEFISIIISRENKPNILSYLFKVLVKGETCCTGIISAELLFK